MTGLLIQTNGTTAQTVDSGQRTKFPTTIGVGDATPSASGSGISFPATQSASSDANTLDDYEEGTWTPTIIGTTTAGTATYSGQVASYTKIGRMVQIVGYINWSSGTGTGPAMRIAGLPFTVLSSANADDAPCSIYTGNITTSASTVIGAAFRSNNTNIAIVEVPVGNGTTGNCAYDASGYAYFAGTYITAT
jgi:hypothetical protein